MLSTARPILSGEVGEIVRTLRKLDASSLSTLPTKCNEAGVNAYFLVIQSVLDENDHPLMIIARNGIDGVLDRFKIPAAID